MSEILPLVISAPYGNYIQPKGATPTLGTFTATARPGRWLRVAQTVRFYPKIGAWTNQIGLRNPGIDAAPNCHGTKLLSIHGFDSNEWSYLLRAAADKYPLAVELNLSCPNVPGGDDYPPELFERALGVADVIVKLPPVNYEAMLEAALRAGVSKFHATNAIPTASGGISGKPLKPFALAVVRAVRKASRHALIIGGGGITTPEDISDFAVAGANRFAVASGALWAWRLPVLISAAREPTKEGT